MFSKPVKVLVIDDSALVRQVLTNILSRDKSLEVVGAVVDPLYAIKSIKELKPDVLTLDLEMPRMDGLTFLEKLMSVYPMPVVVISSRAQEGSEATFKALELGAVDFVPKPAVGIGKALEESSFAIINKVKSAATANMEELRRQVKRGRMERSVPAKQEKTSDLETAPPPLLGRTDKVVAIGASTGGTVAVKTILQQLPANMPAMLVVLHMPAGFTTSYADSLNSSCRIRVKEASHGETITAGCAYIAPGGKHMLLEKRGGRFALQLDDTTPPVNRHRPSVDKTFNSVAQYVSSNSMGIILTGMGDDGARGIKEMHDKGAFTVAQDEKTSIVFGMPKQAIALGGIDKVLPLDNIGEAVIRFAGERF